MAEVIVIIVLAITNTLIPALLLSLKKIKTFKSCCCSCEQEVDMNTPKNSSFRDKVKNIFTPRKNKNGSDDLVTTVIEINGI